MTSHREVVCLFALIFISSDLGFAKPKNDQVIDILTKLKEDHLKGYKTNLKTDVTYDNNDDDSDNEGGTKLSDLIGNPRQSFTSHRGIHLRDGKLDLRDSDSPATENVGVLEQETDFFAENEILREEAAFLRKLEANDGNYGDGNDEITKLAQRFMERLGTDISYYRRRKYKETNGSSKTKSMKRFIAKFPDLLWDKGVIPYNFSSDISSNKRDDYENIVFKFYQDNSCLKFVDVKNDPKGMYKLNHDNYLRFISAQSCYSLVGNIGRLGQDISCCYWKPCLHECGHAIGFHHEQNNPLRNDYVRINYQNIKPEKFGAFGKKTEIFYKQFGYYDYSSMMHYYLGTWSANAEPSMTLYDPDMKYLVSNPDLDGYYMLNEINNMYGCTVSCNLECTNGGYMAWLKQKCRCKCPLGLASKTGCATPSDHAKWPQDQFSILRPKAGCPSGFEYGWRINWAFASRDLSSTVNTSDEYKASGTVGLDFITHEFCTKTYTQHYGKKSEWSAGKYCILRAGASCPNGFTEGSYTFDGRKAPPENTSFGGNIPTGVEEEDMTLTFCCHGDGATSTAITLPIEYDIILFKFGKNCQEINGMVAEEQSFTFQNDITGAQGGVGVHPSVTVTDPNTVTLPFCYYTKSSDDVTCGGVIELDTRNPSKTIRSPKFPGEVTARKDCTWFVKVPENSKIKLIFTTFLIRSSNDGCDDTVSIGSYLPGMPGIPYCGDSFKKTVITRANTLHLRLTQNESNKASRFVAKVSLLAGEDQCYTGHGQTYRGKMSFTEGFEPCVPWDRVQHCPHHMFNLKDADYNLEGNYCRNPDSGIAPWCYTNAETCTRAYCDVCQVSTCLDMASDCEVELIADPDACQDDPHMMDRCMKTCGACITYTQLPGLSSVTCGQPAIPDDSEVVVPLRELYIGGDEVTLKCKTRPETMVTRCQEDGSWSPVTFVCGVCDPGWSFFDNSCYRLSKTENVNILTAESMCSKVNAALTTDVNRMEDNFLKALIINEKGELPEIWIRLFDSVDGIYQWGDGSEYKWTSWDDGQPEAGHKECVTLDTSGKWKAKSCTETASYVCKYKQSERVLCADQQANCETIIRRNPNFCEDHASTMALDKCALSCGMCSDPKNMTSTICQDEGLSQNASVKTQAVSAGGVIHYMCNDDLVLAEGDLDRACLTFSELTGTPPICKVVEDVKLPVNNNDIRHRRYVGEAGFTYISENSAMTITKSGKITAWEFYSNFDGKIGLQVWRKTSSDTNYRLIGQNIVSTTKDDRKRRIELKQSDRIPVTPDDLIGLYYDAKIPGGVPYDKCSSDFASGGKWKMLSDKVTDTGQWSAGSKYSFKSFSGCYVFSLNAEVGPA